MKKRNFMHSLEFFLVFSLLIFAGCSNNNEDDVDYLNNESNKNKYEDVQFLIATCPTTYNYLKEIKMNDDFIVQTDSTADALRLLNSDSVQIAFVGRNAYAREIKADFIKNEIFDRYTIVSKTNNPLLLDNLQMHTIYTYMLEEDLSEFDYLNFNHIDKKEIHNDEFGESFFLILWSDFDELSIQGFNLINIYSGASKFDSFRNPSLYYSKQYEGIVEQIIQAILQE